MEMFKEQVKNNRKLQEAHVLQTPLQQVQISHQVAANLSVVFQVVEVFRVQVKVLLHLVPLGLHRQLEVDPLIFPHKVSPAAQVQEQ